MSSYFNLGEKTAEYFNKPRGCVESTQQPGTHETGLTNDIGK